ncbi:MAG: ribose ABC transporter permease [Bacteroidetes bacterium]|jgi:ribose/xylose/arabinose/galactoside ABC-type transport system permease subunit|nr:ribose ABC transporter permease [Bacteroidota bacterium]
MSSLVSRYGIALALVLEIVLFSLLSPFFFSAENLLNVTLQVSITAIIAAGMTFVILTGGIDLSVGSMVAFSGVVAALVLQSSLPFSAVAVLAMLAALAVGTISGWSAGWLVTRYRVAPFIVTLALMTVWRGAAFTVTDGRPVWGLAEGFSDIASARLIGIPLPTAVMAVVFIVAHVVLTSTRFGRAIVAVGGNREAARLAGVPVKRVLVTVYAVCGGLSALSGFLLASRMNSGQPNAGLMYELDVIAAVVVGGTSLSGGRGTIVGTLIGTLLIGVLRNGLNLLNVGSYIQQILVGLVIVGAVLLDRSQRK